MDEDRALVPIKVQPPQAVLPSRDELNIIGTIAKTVIGARGHAVPASIDSAAKAAAVMLAGWELGVRPMTALRHISVINGRTEPDAQLMAGLVLAKEPSASFNWIERSHEKAIVRLDRVGRPGIISEFTIEDAKRSGQFGKPGPWKEHTRDMLAYNAIKRACRIGAPDLINQVANISVADTEAAFLPDVGDVDVDSLPEGTLYSDGDVVDMETGEVIETAPAASASEVASPASPPAGAFQPDWTELWTTLRPWKVGPYEVAAYLQVDKDHIDSKLQSKEDVAELIEAFRPKTEQPALT